MQLREEGCLQKVGLVAAKKQLEPYQDAGIISKQDFMREMRQMITSTQPNMTENQTIKMESALLKMHRVFDIDKNGILDVKEVAAALVILCRGSIGKKVKFGLQVFSSTDTKNDISIKYAEFRTFIHFIFKLSLESSNEIMLDYDLYKLAGQVATGAFDFAGIDPEKATINMNQVMQYLSKVSD